MRYAELDALLAQMPPRERVTRIAAAILLFDDDVLRRVAYMAGVVSGMGKRLCLADRIAVARMLADISNELDPPLDQPSTRRLQ
jgi:hypothetical protein